MKNYRGSKILNFWKCVFNNMLLIVTINVFINVEVSMVIAKIIRKTFLNVL